MIYAPIYDPAIVYFARGPVSGSARPSRSDRSSHGEGRFGAGSGLIGFAWVDTA